MESRPPYIRCLIISASLSGNLTARDDSRRFGYWWVGNGNPQTEGAADGYLDRVRTEELNAEVSTVGIHESSARAAGEDSHSRVPAEAQCHERPKRGSTWIAAHGLPTTQKISIPRCSGSGVPG